MATWEDVRRIALSLPEAKEGTTHAPHFDGYPAVLVRLEEISVDELEEVIVEAWLDRAPKRIAAQYLDTMK